MRLSEERHRLGRRQNTRHRKQSPQEHILVVIILAVLFKFPFYFIFLAAMFITIKVVSLDRLVASAVF